MDAREHDGVHPELDIVVDLGISDPKIPILAPVRTPTVFHDGRLEGGDGRECPAAPALTLIANGSHHAIGAPVEERGEYRPIGDEEPFGGSGVPSRLKPKRRLICSGV